MDIRAFAAELDRRKVWRVTAIYAVASLADGASNVRRHRDTLKLGAITARTLMNHW